MKRDALALAVAAVGALPVLEPKRFVRAAVVGLGVSAGAIAAGYIWWRLSE